MELYRKLKQLSYFVMQLLAQETRELDVQPGPKRFGPSLGWLTRLKDRSVDPGNDATIDALRATTEKNSNVCIIS